MRRLPFEPVALHGLSMRQLAAVLSRADAFVCNDTGVMHLAAAVGTPLVAVFGPTDPDEWKPPGAEFIAVRGSGGRCEAVEVTQVLQALQALPGSRLISRAEHAGRSVPADPQRD
jgi:ADP-heptose:LPS heptosyltransferase